MAEMVTSEELWRIKTITDFEESAEKLLDKWQERIIRHLASWNRS